MKLIPLTKGKFAMVDDGDYEWLSQWKWHIRKRPNTCYAERYRRKDEPGIATRIHMHRAILGLNESKLLTDHRDHNGLNNQRYNLRPATSAQNNINSRRRKKSTSKYRGVYLSKLKWRDKKYIYWVAQIRHNNKSVHLGCFKNEVDAALCYNEAAAKYHGEFANLNKLKLAKIL